MAKRRNCQRKRKTKVPDGESRACGGDRISNLPVDIIHKILYQVPIAEQAKVSVLSKRWRSIWASHPSLYLDESSFGADYSSYTERDKAKRDAFLTYAVKSMESRERPCEYSCAIDIFLFRMVVESSSSEALVPKLINFALTSKAKVLYLSLKSTYGMHFKLRRLTFISYTLLDLIIQDCEIRNCSFMLPNLRRFVLCNVLIDDDNFGDLMAGCPEIEHLSIENPHHLKRIVVPNHNLIFFRVHRPFVYSKIQIQSSNLESLELSAACVDLFEIEIAFIAKIRNLTLQDVYCNQESKLMNLINRFPLLDKLLIDESYSGDTQTLYISHQHLTSFVVKVRNAVKEIKIDAPKLKSFEVTGGLKSFTGIKASRELKLVKFHLIPQKLDARWYTWLKDLLKSFAHVKHLCLICQNEQVIIFPDKLIERLLPTIYDLKNLELRINSSTVTSQQILEDFCWILPGLKTLSLTLGSISKVIEFPERGDDLKVLSTTRRS